MKKFLFILFLSLFFLPSLVFAAGVCNQGLTSPGENLLVLTFSCQADAGDGSFPSTVTNETITKAIKGYFMYEVRTNPGTAPTTLYDIVLNNLDGIDLAVGTLANRSATASERVTPWATIDGPITPVITNNTENSAQVVIKVFLSR